MSHKALIGGTSYNITGGKTLVGGTGYKITKGRSLVDGTGYDINFELPIMAMLYSDGDMAFQRGSDVADGKTLVNSYTGFEDKVCSSYTGIPWYSQRNNIRNVYFNGEVNVDSLNYWFYYSN